MKVAILAGGYGSRLSEETGLKPKPMVEIGGQPILWHIMKIYSFYGYNEFVIALGYKGEYIKDYFANYHYRSRNISIQTSTGEIEIHNGRSENWVVHLIETGSETQTGGRVKRIAEFIGNETFLLTYGDGVANIKIPLLIDCHKKSRRIATVTAVRPPARFGEIEFDEDLVTNFAEKPQVKEGWINGGFYVLEPNVMSYVSGDISIWEQEPMELLTADRQLSAYRHYGFWQCMDTMRDVRQLENLWQSGSAPWKVWA